MTAAAKAKPVKTAREKITDAFVLLLAEHHYTDITVTEIVQRAGVSRVSFYRNFRSTAEILSGMVSNVLSALTDAMLPILQSNDRRQWRDFLFRFTYGMQEACMILQGCLPENLAVLESVFAQQVRQLSALKQPAGLCDKYTPLLLLSSLVTAVMTWFSTGMAESAEELVNYLLSIVDAFTAGGLLRSPLRQEPAAP